MCRLHPYTKQKKKIFVQTLGCTVALWKSWVCKYSIRFQVIKLKLLCETLKNEKWKILAWYPNKMRRYRQRNPKCGDWRWTNFQMHVALPFLNILRCWFKVKSKSTRWSAYLLGEWEKKIMFSVKDFVNKSEQICRKLRAYSHLINKSFPELLFFVSCITH